MSTSLFPDVNVWVALAHARHPHFTAASAWMGSVRPDDALYFCRFTQIALLRLLTTRAAMGEDVLTQAAAWNVFDLFLEDGRNRMMREPRGMEAGFRSRTKLHEASAKQWADGYLAAFAEAAELRLVTFDRALAASAADAHLLSPTP